MISYWATSAVVALFFNERHTPAVLKARSAFTSAHMWAWGRIEMESAVLRREPSGARQAAVTAFARDLQFHDIAPTELPTDLALNRRHRLRAADAGHLYCFRRLSLVHPDAQLVCFDAELCSAARAAKLRVWSP